MIRYYLRTLYLLFIFFQAKAQDENMVSLYPFEDYSNCTTGFLNGSTWPRDTIYPAKFDFVSEIGDIFNRDQHRNYPISNWIVSENGKYGCLSQVNKWFLNCVYDSLNYDSFSDQFIARKNGKVGTLNLQKQTVFPFEFNEIYTESPLLIGYYEYSEGDWWGNWANEIFARKNGLLGAYDKNAKSIIEPDFDSIRSFYCLPRTYSDTIFKRFYRVKKNDRFGLYSEGKLLIPVEYSQLEILYENQMAENMILFSAADSSGRQCVLNEHGKQLTPFSEFGYQAMITMGTKQEFQTLNFVSETDPETKKQRVTNLMTGKISDWYPQIRLAGNCCWAKLGDHWLILDSNFNKTYTQKNTNDCLYCFDAEHELNPVENLHNNDDYRESGYSNGYEYIMPQVFVIERKSLDEPDQPILYGLVNASSGKQSSINYNQVIRLRVDSDYYYWCFYEIKDSSAQQSEVSVDIYNGKCKLLNSIRVNQSKEELEMPYRSSYSYNSKVTFPFVQSTLPNGKYTIHGVDGWQPKFREFEDRVMSIYKLNNSTGNIRFADTSYRQYFTDFNGKPLLDGKHFEVKRYISSVKWVLDLKDESGIRFVNEKLEILLDSCQEYNYWDYVKIIGPASYNRTNLFAIRKGYVYLLDNDSMKLVDAKMFTNPTGMNEIASRFYVDDSGKKIPDEQVDLYLKSQNTNIGYLWFRIENGQLYVEDQKHQLAKVIPNVYNYKPNSSHSITVVTKDKKEGVLNCHDLSWKLEPEYEHVVIVEGGAKEMIFVQDKRYHDTCWFIVDNNSKPITKPIFDRPFAFQYDSDWNYVFSNGKIGTINRKFEWLTEPEYSEANTIGRVTIMKGTDRKVIVNEYTGKSFRIVCDSVILINDKYLFLSNDSMQILDLDGKELLSPVKISDAMNSMDIGKFFYEADNYRAIPYAEGNHLFVPVNNKFLMRLNNQLIIENARYEAISLLDPSVWWRYSYTTNEQRCYRISTFLNDNAYSEKLEGECFVHAGSQGDSYRKVTFRNYWIQDNSLVPIKKLGDLFKEESDYDSLLDKFIAEQIQNNQTFGVACANIPAAVAEFKHNFYLRDHYLGFIYYDASDNYYVEIDLNILKSVLKDFL